MAQLGEMAVSTPAEDNWPPEFVVVVADSNLEEVNSMKIIIQGVDLLHKNTEAVVPSH